MLNTCGYHGLVLLKLNCAVRALAVVKMQIPGSYFRNSDLVDKGWGLGIFFLIRTRNHCNADGPKIKL